MLGSVGVNLSFGMIKVALGLWLKICASCLEGGKHVGVCNALDC